MSKKKEDKKKARVKIKDLKLRKEGEGIKGGAAKSIIQNIRA